MEANGSILTRSQRAQPLLVPDETVGLSGQGRYFANPPVTNSNLAKVSLRHAHVSFWTLVPLACRSPRDFGQCVRRRTPPAAISISKLQRSRPLTHLCDAWSTSLSLAGLIGGRNGGLALTPKRDRYHINQPVSQPIA